jgi:hypothetical protein
MLSRAISSSFPNQCMDTDDRPPCRKSRVPPAPRALPPNHRHTLLLDIDMVDDFPLGTITCSTLRLSSVDFL